MRKTIILGLMAAIAMPSVASAQTRELRRDRQDVRQEQRDVRDARRYGDRQDVREERRELRGARRELREDLRDYRRDEWRGWRNQNRRLYARGAWNSPYRYQAFRPGIRIQSGYYSQRYWIADPYRYRLPRAASYQRWVRHYDDVLLIDTRRGIVIDVIRGFYW